MKYQHNSTPKKSRFKKVLLSLLLLAILVGGIAYNRFDNWYHQNLLPLSNTSDNQTFVIESGQSASQIAQNLQEAGLIRNSRAVIWYVDRTGNRTKLQSGTYRLSPDMSVEMIVEWITTGKVDNRLITIVPGSRVDQIRQELIDEGFDADRVDQALSKSYDHPLLAEKPDTADLEGYILPESYEINANSTPESVIERTFEIFWARVDQATKDGIKEQGLSFHEAIILASIIAGESPDPTLQKQIAQVFLKRLDEGIVLGADPTFFYAAEVLGVEPRPDLDSPYNTRIYGGLPPGPIGNFNVSALEAVAQPASGDFLYFVAGDDGQTYFANTEAEHQSNVETYCIELCKIGSGN